MRASVDLDASYECCVRFIHDHVTRFQLFEYMLIQISIVRMNDDQVIHFIQLEVVFHFDFCKVVINHYIIFLISSRIIGLHLRHQGRDLRFWILCCLNTAIYSSPTSSRSRRPTTNAASFVGRCLSSKIGRSALITQRGVAIKSFLVLIEERRADFGEVLFPLEIIPQFASQHEIC